MHADVSRFLSIQDNFVAKVLTVGVTSTSVLLGEPVTHVVSVSIAFVNNGLHSVQMCDSIHPDDMRDLTEVVTDIVKSKNISEPLAFAKIAQDVWSQLLTHLYKT